MLLKRKGVRIAAWTIAGLFTFYLLALFIAGIYIDYKQKGLLQYITQQISQRVRGNVSIRSMKVSPWTSFPSIDFRFNDILITDSLHKQPVLQLQTVSSSFSLFQLMRGKTSVENVFLENGQLHLLTDSTGYSNSFFKKDSSHRPANTGENNFEISRVRLKNITIILEHQVKQKEISFTIASMLARIKNNGNLQDIAMTERVEMKKGLGFNLVRGAFLEKQSINGTWQLQYNQQTNTLSFKDAQVNISRQPFVLNGHFAFGKTDPNFKVAFRTENLAYDLAKSVVNARIRKKLSIVDLKEKLNASGVIEGSLLPAHEPAVSIAWETRNNTIVTEAGTFSHCNFIGNFNNHVVPALGNTDSNSAISFYKLSADWDGIPFTADSCSISNLDSARVRMHIKSDCRLEDLDNKLGMESIAFKKGRANVDAYYDGPLVQDKSILQSVRGSIKLRDGEVEYSPRGFNFTQCNGSLYLFRDSIRMEDFTCRYGDNKFDVALYSSSIRSAGAGNDAAAFSVMDCFVSSSFINLDDFTSLFAQRKQRSNAKKAGGSFGATARGIDAMLDNSNIAVHVKAAGFKRGNLKASKLEAVVAFEPQSWELQKIAMNIAGGSIACNGKVLHTGSNSHTASFNIEVNNTDVSKLLFAFDNFGQEALTHEELSGRFSTKSTLQAGINNQGHIIPASLKGEVHFSLQEASLENYEPLNKLKSFVFKNRDLKHVRFAELKDKLSINGQQIGVSRMEIQSSAFRLFLEGNYGLAKKNTDLLIQVPFSNLNDNSFEKEEGPVNKGVKAKTGASIWLRAVNDDDGKIKVKLTMRKKLKGDTAAD
ncbi:MAG TPA: AsmA-like C-terminal region-containing protein [Chitinophagaceae bacterium]|nr:AsmA-like C-terminal region-containing protein [Chitinophagaceae bacterium]